MADFEKAFRITIYGNEGGYNPGDGEAETYMGIDRSMNPGWSGWAIIDVIKRDYPQAPVSKLNVLFSQNAALQANILAFYKTNYWDDLMLDAVNDQQVANNIFDCSVNPCINSAAQVLQKACNIVKSASVNVDGQIGQLTLAVVNALDGEALYTAINQVRTANYKEEVARNPHKAEWLPIWLSRLKKYVKS